MTSPKVILNSPHVVAAAANKNPLGASQQHKNFEPMKYLIRAHRFAFEALMKLWGIKPVPEHGQRMSESVLTILCHILEGEKTIEEYVQKEKKLKESKQPKLAPSISVENTVSNTATNPLPRTQSQMPNVLNNQIQANNTTNEPAVNQDDLPVSGYLIH
jgi:hypothetical protein